MLLVVTKTRKIPSNKQTNYDTTKYRLNGFEVRGNLKSMAMRSCLDISCISNARQTG